MAGRVTQLTVEAVIAATSSSVRTTQVAVEAVIAPTSQSVRTTQLVVEAVIAPTSQNLLVSGAGLEVLRAPDPSEVDLLVSQAGIEVAYELPKGTFTLNAAIVIRRTYGTKSVFYGYSGAPIVIKTPNKGQPQEIVIPGCDLTISGGPITISWDVWQSHFQWAVDKKEVIYIRRDSLAGIAIWSDDPQRDETDAGNNATGRQWHFYGSYTETARSGRYVLTIKPAKGNATLYASEIHFALATPGDGPGITLDAVIGETRPGTFRLKARILKPSGPIAMIDDGTADAVIKGTQFSSVEANATLFVWGLGAFFTYATVLKPTGSSFAVNAVKYEAYGGGFTWADSFKADALIGPHTGSFAADAAVLSPISSSLGLDASISGAISVDAVIYRLIAITWTTPPDAVSIIPTETLAFLTPLLNGSQHFEIQLDTVNSFDGPDLRVLKSHYDLTGWEFWDGGAWQALPQSGMPAIYGGNEARYTIQTPLTGGTWYRRVRAGEI